MFLSPEEPKISLIADPGSPTASVSITDAAYQTVAQSVGRLEIELPAGLYKVRYETGSELVENVFELSAEQAHVNLDSPRLSVLSPAPLVGSPGVAPGQGELAVDLSTQRAIPLGTGSELFIFVRDASQLPGDSARTSTAPPNPASSLKLLDFTGKVIQDFGLLASVNGCAGVNLALNPGSYVLRQESPTRDSLEQTIVTSPGWQTQVFLPLAQQSVADELCLPSLEDAGVFLAPLGEGFRADAREATWVEMARTWLARGEPVVPLEELKRGRDLANETRQYAIDQTSLREMLRAKFINPMLGIYAAHLMMIAPDPDEALLREVAENLKILLGDHPDVTAIELWLDAKNAAPPFLSPPMLRSSWSILVNRSLVDQKLVPPGSYTLRITGRLWGSGPWLVWRTPSPALAPATAADAGADALTEEVLRALYADLSRLLSKENVSKLIGAETIDKQLTDVESSVLSYTANIVQGQMLAQTLSRQLERKGWLRPLKTLYYSVLPSGLVEPYVVAKDSLSKDNIVQALGMPLAALSEAALGLHQKLRLK